MMQAVVQEQYGGPEVLRVDDVPKPSPKDNELLIRVHSVPITAAGGFMRTGTPYLGRLAIGLFKPKHNIPGVGFSGEVESMGDEVQGYQIGDKVFGETLFNQGTHAEYVCVPQNDVITKKPENITHAEAAPIIDGHLTSMNYLSQVYELKAGEKILIIGASGALGTAAVQIAKEMGAHVTGVCSQANIALVKALGADEVIDYKKEDFSAQDEKYDVIYDTVAKSDFNTSKSVLAERGVYMCPVLSFSLFRQSICTSLFGKKKARFSATGIVPKQELKEMLARIRTMISEEKLRTHIDRKYELAQVSEAHRYVDTGHKRGNVVLLIRH